MLYFKNKTLKEVFPPSFEMFLETQPSLISEIRDCNCNIFNLSNFSYEIHKYNSQNTDENFVILVPKQKELSDLFSLIIHELKNPLAAIRAMIQVVITGVEQKKFDSNKILSYMKRILSEIDRMNRIFTSITKLSKPRSKFLVGFDLLEVTKNTLIMWNEELVRLNIKKRLSSNKQHIFFAGNPDEFAQIINNLISNSIKALEKTKNPSIEINLRDSEYQILIEVIDNGKGMDKETLKKVKTGFYSTKTDGLGIGLFVVKTLAERNNGTLDIVSEQNKGTKITINLLKNE